MSECRAGITTSKDGIGGAEPEIKGSLEAPGEGDQRTPFGFSHGRTKHTIDGPAAVALASALRTGVLGRSPDARATAAG